ncbi:trypsin-like peptidase domain-containing protein [Embleya hyalina]|uniref:Protease n=1 Tax=Embleya hyalina TaxID=516124 RepID=A0A401Z3Q6_9ACTN|nr:trypsin-like peptidase domain-containing protein [Embleya hyalina]GCE01481.1 protease [Embleya hyalina]
MSDAYGRGGAEPPRGDDAPAGPAPEHDHGEEPAAFPPGGPRVSTDPGEDTPDGATSGSAASGHAADEEPPTEIRPVSGAEAAAGDDSRASDAGAEPGRGDAAGEPGHRDATTEGPAAPGGSHAAGDGFAESGRPDAADAEPAAFPARTSLAKDVPAGAAVEPPPADPAAEPDAFGAPTPDVRDAVTAEVPVVHGTAELPVADDPGYDPFAPPPPPQPPPAGPPPQQPTGQWPGYPAQHGQHGQPGPYGVPAGAAHPGYGPYGPYPSYAPQTGYAPYQAVPYGYAVPGDMTGAGGPTEDLGRRYGRRLVVWAAALALVAGLIGGGIGAWIADRHDTRIRLGDPPQSGPARGKDTIAGLADRTLPGVVYIHAKTGRGEATGTGFVLDTAGDILTNNHVVDSAASGGTITVTFNDGQRTTATLVGRDAGYDLAVIRVSGVQGLHPLPLGNSDGVQVGDPVIAIGAPFNLEGTVTSGIISAKDRAVSAGSSGSDVSYISALQTDAPINPGNSGGPLIDAAGSVIGINSAIRSAGGGGQGNPFGAQQESGSIGLGFAIPINQARRVAQQLIDTGKASHPVIGVSLDVAYTGDGARIASEDVKGTPPVRPGGPAERAGLKPGDVIKAIDGRRVHDANELIVAIRSKAPGGVVKLTIERDGAERSVEMTLEAG